MGDRLSIHDLKYETMERPNQHLSHSTGPLLTNKVRGLQIPRWMHVTALLV